MQSIQAEGARPILFGYPLERTGYTSQHRTILAAAAEELGVPHFDPQAQMEEERFEVAFEGSTSGHARWIPGRGDCGSR